MKPMLSATIDDIKQLDKRYPLYASPKLDGIRTLVVGGQLLSRNLKPIPNLFVQRTMHRELDLRALEGLDGELIVGDPHGTDVFQRTTSGVMSKDGAPDFTFWVFDKYDCADYDYRYKLVQQICKHFKHERMKHVPQVKLHDSFEVHEYEGIMLEKGYEGIMLRTATGLYKQGRSTIREGHLMKLKRFADSEAKIIGFQERMHNANEKTIDALGKAKRSSHKANKHGTNILGALHVRDIHTGVEFDVGTGFDDSLRSKIWHARKMYLGKIIKYKHFPNGVKEKPRFPVFLGFRKD